MDYLYETYGGSKENPNKNDSFYCYTIKDNKNNKFYSGVKIDRNCSTHTLLIKYFTSSSVVDFKDRLFHNVSEFIYYVEYFRTSEEAFKAEADFHKKFDVGGNKLFYNSINACGTNCGAGTVLCRNLDTNQIYRVSMEEYDLGNHTSASVSLMSVYLKNDTKKKLKKISCNDYNPEIHVTQFKNYILVYDIKENKYRRVPREEYEKNDNYVGATKGKVSVIEISTGIVKQITKDEYDNNKELYKFSTEGMVNAINKETNKKVIITQHEFRQNKQKYKHANEGNCVVFSIEKNDYIRITKDEYYTNKDKYINSSLTKYKCTEISTGNVISIDYKEYLKNKHLYCRSNRGKRKVFDAKQGKSISILMKDEKYPWYIDNGARYVYLINNIIFTHRVSFSKYIKTTYNISVRNIKLDKLIEIITHYNGKVIERKDFIKLKDGNFSYEN